jgi:gas vesicle protein
MSSHYTTVKVISSFVIGAAVGAVAALFFAPMPGRKMQRKAGKLAGKMVDKVEDFALAARKMAS